MQQHTHNIAGCRLATVLLLLVLTDWHSHVMRIDAQAQMCHQFSAHHAIHPTNAVLFSTCSHTWLQHMQSHAVSCIGRTLAECTTLGMLWMWLEGRRVCCMHEYPQRSRTCHQT